MAASRWGMLLGRTPGISKNTLFKHCPALQRIQLEFVRERKRTTRPARWHVPRKSATPTYKFELTTANRHLLKEMAIDQYAPTSTLQGQVSPLHEDVEPWPRNEWTRRTMRTGVLAVKIGVVPQWTQTGHKFYCTMLQVLDNHVVRYVPPDEFVKSKSFKEKWKRRVGMVVVGALSSDPSLFQKSYNNLFAEAGIPPKRKLTRFLVSEDAAIQPGTPLNATHFQVGDYVDVQAKTIGHGFQGVVKRWGFKGGPASHGATKFQRRPGATGGGGDKSAIWKGKKMPGHMGMDWRHLRGLRIWKIDTNYNVLYVHSPCIPGPTHCYVRIMDTTLYYRQAQRLEQQPLPYMPTFYPEDAGEEGLPGEIFHPELFQFTHPTLTFDGQTK